ncbi:hypothetical protein ACLQ2R_34355 [Streptosporangium sp. DT93]|uniref:hypothetical protein n=1 Tax=Streptosporangium sp. DT93 TaxID=3393428 RepID=UPI003CED9D36
MAVAGVPHRGDQGLGDLPGMAVAGLAQEQRPGMTGAIILCPPSSSVTEYGSWVRSTTS